MPFNLQMLAQSNDIKSSTRHIVLPLLQKQQITARALKLDESFVQKCLDDTASLGCPMAPNGDVPSFHRSNRTGAAMAFFGYNHIDDMQVKLYIGTYTSLVVYIEDAFSDKLEVIQDFNTRFTSGETQRLPVLTALATHLRKTSAYFNDVQANAIITATLNFMASLWMENHFPEVSQCQAPGGEDVTLSSKLLAGCDCGFPTYVRNMSGNGQPYAMFIFPKDLDSKVYAQAIPTLTLIAVYFK